MDYVLEQNSKLLGTFTRSCQRTRNDHPLVRLVFKMYICTMNNINLFYNIDKFQKIINMQQDFEVSLKKFIMTTIEYWYYVCAKLPQSCLILCNPMDCSQPGSSVHGILQARILERVAISSSRLSS